MTVEGVENEGPAETERTALAESLTIQRILAGAVPVGDVYVFQSFAILFSVSKLSGGERFNVSMFGGGEKMKRHK